MSKERYIVIEEQSEPVYCRFTYKIEQGLETCVIEKISLDEIDGVNYQVHRRHDIVKEWRNLVDQKYTTEINAYEAFKYGLETFFLYQNKLI